MPDPEAALNDQYRSLRAALDAELARPDGDYGNRSLDLLRELSEIAAEIDRRRRWVAIREAFDA